MKENALLPLHPLYPKELLGRGGSLLKLEFRALGFIRDSCDVAVGDEWWARKGEIRLLDFVSNACVSIFLLRAPRRAGYGKAVAQEKGRRKFLRPFSFQTRVPRVGAAGCPKQKTIEIKMLETKSKSLILPLRASQSSPTAT